jgi:hypothetical protein
MINVHWRIPLPKFEVAWHNARFYPAEDFVMLEGVMLSRKITVNELLESVGRVGAPEQVKKEASYLLQQVRAIRYKMREEQSDIAGLNKRLLLC